MRICETLDNESRLEAPVILPGEHPSHPKEPVLRDIDEKPGGLDCSRGDPLLDLPVHGPTWALEELPLIRTKFLEADLNSALPELT